jgi:hypothetical protein
MRNKAARDVAMVTVGIGLLFHFGSAAHAQTTPGSVHKEAVLMAYAKGSFVLQHTGTMTRGAPELGITVVPDSGTGELVGLAGKMTIKIVEGKHFYEFDYTLPESH